MTSCPPPPLENKHLLSEQPPPLPKGQASQARGPQMGLSPALSKVLCPSRMQKGLRVRLPLTQSLHGTPPNRAYGMHSSLLHLRALVCTQKSRAWLVRPGSPLPCLPQAADYRAGQVGERPSAS